MATKGRTVPVSSLSAEQKSIMFDLMRKYYENVTTDEFERDLERKDLVILIENDGQLVGFSTQVLFDHQHQGSQIKVLFSGDTIIEKQHWNTMALPLAWGRLMLDYCDQYKEHDIYWLLTSKGYKTYRFLPVFFKEYYPHCEVETPEVIDELIDSLGSQFFADRYDTGSMILRAAGLKQKLTAGVADIDERKLKDKHISYFNKINPGHIHGDELIAVAKCSKENITSFIARRL